MTLQNSILKGVAIAVLMGTPARTVTLMAQGQ